MVRKKVRTVFLLFKKNSKGKEKGKNSNLTFPKNYMVRKKVRTGFLLFKKKNKNKKKIKKLRVMKKVRTQILLFKTNKHMVWQKVRARSLLLKKQTNKQTNIQTNK